MRLVRNATYENDLKACPINGKKLKMEKVMTHDVDSVQKDSEVRHRPSLVSFDSTS